MSQSHTNKEGHQRGIYNTDMLCQFLTTTVSPEGALFVAGQCHGLNRSWLLVFKRPKSKQNIPVYDCETKVYHLYIVYVNEPSTKKVLLGPADCTFTLAHRPVMKHSNTNTTSNFHGKSVDIFFTKYRLCPLFINVG